MGVKKSSLLESSVREFAVCQEVQSVKESSLPVSPVCQGVYCLSRSPVCQEVQSVGLPVKYMFNLVGSPVFLGVKSVRKSSQSAFSQTNTMKTT
jgi:hypothetical protein